MPRAEARRLHVASNAGDADATASLAALWTDTSECFICGGEMAPGVGTTIILPDRPDRTDMSMLARQCDDCAALPFRYDCIG